ncbi:MAG: NADH-quinone oxidoreductase subunit C [Deltaproteobacteria bacterium]|nr:MAG: NADH-quinone oxidoreductase subunit C [Deltaproteobacteria bacterium]
MEDHGSTALRRLIEAQRDALVETHARLGDATALVERGQVAALLRFLRDDPDCGFDVLTDLTAVDYLGETPRFEVVYHLFSYTNRHRLRVKTRVPEEEPEVDTATGLWPSANWLEREVYDMYGIRFREHPDLRRLLLYEQFEGHPLRKDYAKERRQPLLGPRN